MAAAGEPVRRAANGASAEPPAEPRNPIVEQHGVGAGGLVVRADDVGERHRCEQLDRDEGDTEAGAEHRDPPHGAVPQRRTDARPHRRRHAAQHVAWCDPCGGRRLVHPGHDGDDHRGADRRAHGERHGEVDHGKATAGQGTGRQAGGLRGLGPRQAGLQVAAGRQGPHAVDVPRLERPRVERPPDTAEGGADGEHGERAAEAEGQALDGEQAGRHDQHRPASDHVGEAAGRQLEDHRGQPVDRRDRADGRQVQPALLEQEHEHRHLQAGLEPAHGEQDQEPPAQRALLVHDDAPRAAASTSGTA